MQAKMRKTLSAAMAAATAAAAVSTLAHAAPPQGPTLPNYGDIKTATDLLNACSVIQGGQYRRVDAELAGACTAALRGAFFLTKDEDSTRTTGCLPAVFDNPGLIDIYRAQFAQAKGGRELEYMAFANAALLIHFKCAAPSRLIESMMVTIQSGHAPAEPAEPAQGDTP